MQHLRTITRLALLCSGLWLGACATAPQSRPAPAPEPSGSASDCQGLRHAGTPFRPTGVSGDAGWVVVLYALDGSGAARDVRVQDSSGVTGSSQYVVQYLQSSAFAPGEVRASCREVFSFARRKA